MLLSACVKQSIFLEALTLRDVDDCREHEVAAIDLQGTEPDFDGDFAAILAARKEIAAGAHRPGNGVGDKIISQGGMTASKVQRYEHFVQAAEHFFTLVAEELLRLCVHESDGPAVVDEHFGVRRGLDHVPEKLFVVALRS